VSDEWRLLIELDADGALAPAAKELVAGLDAEIGLHRAGDSRVTYADGSGGTELLAEVESRAPGAPTEILEGR
jgi:hypothetical protein